MIELYLSKELTLTLDPVDTDDHVPSVSFDIVAEMKLTFQHCRIEIKSCWFENENLNEFENQLSALIKVESGNVTLENMSEKPIFVITKNGNEVLFSIHALDTMGLGKAKIEASGHASQLQLILEKLRGYPKWW